MLSMNPCVAAAMRESLAGGLDVLSRVLGIDEGLSDCEKYEHVILDILFLQRELKNPVVALTTRIRNGDFAPLQPNEDPNNLARGREPLDDDALDVLVDEATELSDRLWQGKASCGVAELVRNAILYAGSGDGSSDGDAGGSSVCECEFE